MKIKNILVLAFILASFGSSAQEKISPFFHLGDSSESIELVIPKVKTALEEAGFKVIGEYHPEMNNDLYVIAYTRDDLINECSKFQDRGLLAATLKVGLITENGITKLSMLNPEYQFIAYLIENYEGSSAELNKISESAIAALKPLGSEFTAFGGEVKRAKLHKYHYKVMMPYFDSPVKLNEFASFKEGLETIQKNLQNKVGSTVKVYQIIDEEKQIAVFGIGLFDLEKGEPDFLPIIGESNLASMPYDLILQGNKATMLHGKYRIALHWPELTMGTFMKIMSTPKNIEKFMKALTK